MGASPVHLLEPTAWAGRPCHDGTHGFYRRVNFRGVPDTIRAVRHITFPRAAFLLVLSAFLVTASLPAGGAEDDKDKEKEKDGFETIFNGKDLTGWVVTGCVTAIEDGVLTIKDGNGFIRYDKELTDFELEIEWKP